MSQLIGHFSFLQIQIVLYSTGTTMIIALNPSQISSFFLHVTAIPHSYFVFVIAYLITTTE